MLLCAVMDVKKTLQHQCKRTHEQQLNSDDFRKVFYFLILLGEFYITDWEMRE